MRKRIVTSAKLDRPPPPDDDWLDVEHLAVVEISSEDASFPIESALLSEGHTGWRAAEPGKQTIRIIFENPQKIRRMVLGFVESINQRTQEYVLRWSPDGGQSFQEIVRQQWNFSPDSASIETEDHRVDLSGVTILELIIVPDIAGGNTVATLAQFRVA